MKPTSPSRGASVAKARELAALLFKSGLAPRELALTLCLGGAIGVLPVPWGTTVLCALVAARLKLNQALIQGVNYIVYPVQLTCYLPFYRVGGSCLPWGPEISPAALLKVAHLPLSGSLGMIGWLALRALAGWAVTVPVLAFLIYPAVLRLFQRRSTQTVARG